MCPPDEVRGGENSESARLEREATLLVYVEAGLDDCRVRVAPRPPAAGRGKAPGGCVLTVDRAQHEGCDGRIELGALGRHVLCGAIDHGHVHQSLRG